MRACWFSDASSSGARAFKRDFACSGMLLHVLHRSLVLELVAFLAMEGAALHDACHVDFVLGS